MSAYSEQEELEKLKSWLKDYGAALIMGILLGLAVLIGNKYWQKYKEERLVTASALYDQLMYDLSKKKHDAVRDRGDRLIEDFASTPYAAKAALILARLSFDAGDNDMTVRRLQWAMEHASDSAVEHTARLRLARLLMDKGMTEEAFSLFNVKDQSGFETEYQELKGDLLALKGRKDEARAAYRAAIDALPGGSSYRRILRMKLDDLGPEESE
ncbi:MAG: YfgM family protein [Gammaproteobacteria bacterium]|nr:MAG: YfgM family protein [Gammaproteobacteria bacterium]